MGISPLDSIAYNGSRPNLDVSARVIDAKILSPSVAFSSRALKSPVPANAADEKRCGDERVRSLVPIGARARDRSVCPVRPPKNRHDNRRN